MSRFSLSCYDERALEAIASQDLCDWSQSLDAFRSCLTAIPAARTRSSARRRRLSDNYIRCSASDRRWFPARPAQHVHRRRNYGKGRIQSALASARVAETLKDASRRATPDAPEHIDRRRRCTRHDHRTCCRGSRGSASLPCHTLRKRVEMRLAGSRSSASIST